jgi:hypothetical protein
MDTTIIEHHKNELIVIKSFLSECKKVDYSIIKTKLEAHYLPTINFLNGLIPKITQYHYGYEDYLKFESENIANLSTDEFNIFISNFDKDVTELIEILKKHTDK